MSLSNIKKSELQGFGDIAVGNHKGWTFVVTAQSGRYTFSLSVETDENSECGVYVSESGYVETIAELKGEIKFAVSDLGYTAKEAAYWNIKLGNGVRTYDELEDAITAYEQAQIVTEEEEEEEEEELNYDDLPEDIRALVDSYSEKFEDGDSYKLCEEMLVEAEAIGWTFDYGLDGGPSDFKKITKAVSGGSVSQPVKKIHHKVYEFGTAPFRYVGIWSPPSKALLEANPNAYNLAMAGRPKCCKFGCDHCGMAIEHHCIIVDAKGERFTVGSSCIFKVGDCENLTQVEADVKARQKANRKRLADAKREKAAAEREAVMQAERDANGGLTNYELGVKNRAEAAKANADAFLELAQYFVAPLNFSGDFGKSIVHGFSNGQIPTGRGKDIVIEIVAKAAGRKNSKAYNAKLPEVEAEFEKLEEAFKNHSEAK